MLLASIFFKNGLDNIFDVRDSHNTVNVIVVDGNARIAGLTHDHKHLGQRGGVFHGGKVNAWYHNLARNRIAHVDNLMDHRLLFFGELVGVFNNIAELLLRKILVIFMHVNTQELCDTVCGS